MTEEKIVEKYLTHIQSYVDGDISAAEFSHTYLDEFKNEDAGLSDETYLILQSLFGAADAYCEDPDLRGEWEIDENQLREEVLKARNQLKSRLDQIGSQ